MAKAMEKYPTETERTCPVCKKVYDNDSWGHAFDAIKEFGKCTECLGECPYCEHELTINGKVVWRDTENRRWYVEGSSSDFVTMDGLVEVLNEINAT